MLTDDEKKSAASLEPEDTEGLAKLGITRVSVDFFHCGGFRYTSLKDAVAQAGRQQPSA